MSISVSDIMSRVQIQVQDETGLRWPEAELLKWLNDGQREIALINPTLFMNTATIALTAGTLQQLPAGAVTLHRIVRNVGGNVVRTVDGGILDTQEPDWHSATASDAVQYLIYDDDDAKHFYVYPPNDGNGSVEAVYSQSPTDLTLSSSLTLADMYANPLINYILYRAYDKDAEFAGNADRASRAYEMFATQMGVSAAAHEAVRSKARTLSQTGKAG